MRQDILYRSFTCFFLHFVAPVTFLIHINLYLDRIFVISQDDDLVFNRAMLFNVGYMEAMKVSDWDCLGQSLSLTVINFLTVSLVFHDVDLIPEDDRNLYTCPSQPRHMSVAVDKFDYQLPYEGIFGGVSAISVKHFNFVNGFSNQFWG